MPAPDDVPGGEVNAAVAELIADQLAAGRHLGVQVAARHHGALVVDVAAGWLDPERSRPVRADSLFCCFSVSKALAAFEIWRLVARGALALDTPLPDVWPGFRTAATVAQVLSHQAGLHRVPRPLTTDFVVHDQAGVEWVAALTPAWEPGTASGYHTLTYGWLVKGLYEAVTGAAFPSQLGLDVCMGLPDTDLDRAATIVEDAAARGLQWLDAGEHPAFDAMPPEFEPPWNDPRLRAARQPAFSGWASARALARHVDAVPADSVALGTALQVDGVDRCLELVVRRGAGVELGGRFDGGAVGALGPNPTAFGHGGHGGQVVVRDPEAELTVAVLVNLLPAAAEAADRTTTICELTRALCGVI